MLISLVSNLIWKIRGKNAHVTSAVTRVTFKCINDLCSGWDVLLLGHVMRFCKHRLAILFYAVTVVYKNTTYNAHLHPKDCCTADAFSAQTRSTALNSPAHEQTCYYSNVCDHFHISKHFPRTGCKKKKFPVRKHVINNLFNVLNLRFATLYQNLEHVYIQKPWSVNFFSWLQPFKTTCLLQFYIRWGIM